MDRKENDGKFVCVLVITFISDGALNDKNLLVKLRLFWVHFGKARNLGTD